MSLDAELQNLSLSGAKKMRDPVSEAAAEGRVPTLGEVKRSLKVCKCTVIYYMKGQLISGTGINQKSNSSNNADGPFAE